MMGPNSDLVLVQNGPRRRMRGVKRYERMLDESYVGGLTEKFL